MKVRRHEKRRTGRFDLVFTITEEERSLLRKTRGQDLPVEIYPNVVDTDFFQTSSLPTSPASLIFVGNFRHAPNTAGILWFVKNVFSSIEQAHPEVTLTLVGPAPPRELLQLGERKSITVTGYVPDIRTYIEKSAIFICPVITGGGMRGKVLEALAMTRPVVSTSRGAEGIEADPQREILLADEPEAFSEAVNRLIRDREMRQEIGKNGRKLVETRYSYGVIFPRMEAFYEELIRTKKEHSL